MNSDNPTCPNCGRTMDVDGRDYTCVCYTPPHLPADPLPVEQIKEAA